MAQELAVQVRRENRTLNRWEQYYRIDRLASFPTRMQFPTGTRCNLRCRFCTERGGAADYQYKDLSFSEFLGIVAGGQWSKALMSVATIALYGRGEPLFSKDYRQIADYLLQGFPSIGIGISSNGVLFDQSWAEKLVGAASADLNFSVNAASAETFCGLTGCDDFATVIENIGRVTKLRRQKGGTSLSVTLSFVATTENVRELPAFVDLAARLEVDSVIVRDIMTLNEETERMSLANEPQLARAMFQMAQERAGEKGMNIRFLRFRTHRERYFPNSSETRLQVPSLLPEPVSDEEATPSPYRLRTDCFGPWERFMIRADGEVFPCSPSQSFPGFTLGNVFRRGFQEIWNGEAYRHMRNAVNSSALPAVCAVCPRKAGLD